MDVQLMRRESESSEILVLCAVGYKTEINLRLTGSHFLAHFRRAN